MRRFNGQLISGVFEHFHVYVYVIAWLGVKFGINFTSVVVRMAKIARGEAECNFAILTTTQVKFIPKFHS